MIPFNPEPYKEVFAEKAALTARVERLEQAARVDGATRQQLDEANLRLNTECEKAWTRIERLEAAPREIADAYDGYDTWSHTTQRRMLRAVEEARAALGDAT